MIIYHAGLSIETVKKYFEIFLGKKVNVLRSIGKLTNEEYDFQVIHRDKVNSLVLDSGTYSLNNSKDCRVKASITLKRYESYLENCSGRFDAHFNFDCDWSKEGFETNLINQFRLESLGFNPIPVIHDIHGDEVNYYLGQRDKYDRLAVGSSYRLNSKAAGWIANELYKDEDKRFKMHLFGNSQYEFLINAPIFSCDSSTAIQTANRDQVLFWNPEERYDYIYLKPPIPTDVKSRKRYETYKYHDEFDKYISTVFGLTYKDLLGRKHGLINRQLVNLYFYDQMEMKVNENHKNVGLSGNMDVGLSGKTGTE